MASDETASARYSWAAAFHTTADANAVGRYLQQLMAAHGGSLDVRQIVDDARSAASPLREVFKRERSEDYLCKRAKAMMLALRETPPVRLHLN